MATSLELPNGASGRNIDELRHEAQRLAEARADSQDALVGHALPSLLRDLHAVATIDSNDRQPALRSLVQATNSTAHFLKNLGAIDLAWVAAERGHQAAQILEDPLYIAAADYTRAQALIGLNAYDRADAIARNAISLLTPDAVAATEVYGMNLLATAFCSEMLGDDPESALLEAQESADRIDPQNAFWLNFSRVNVELWRTSIALEAGDHIKAAEIAAHVRPEDIPTKGRRIRFLIDHARALHGLRGRDDEVTHLLRQAEKLGATGLGTTSGRARLSARWCFVLAVMRVAGSCAGWLTGWGCCPRSDPHRAGEVRSCRWHGYVVGGRRRWLSRCASSAQPRELARNVAGAGRRVGGSARSGG